MQTDCNICCHLDLKVYITRPSVTRLPREEESAAATEEATEETAVVGHDEDVNFFADLFTGVLLGSDF